MYLKKKATVLISTVIILFLMSILGGFMFKMMQNNKELGSLYRFDKDIYDLDKNEEEILNEFMKKLNEDIADNLSDKNSNEADIFSDNFEKNIDSGILKYNKNKNKLYLITNKDNKINRKREIIYSFKGKKIILVPTYKFENNCE